MLPFNEAKWYLGYSSLAMITEQDRQHWLLKTDKLKQIEDSNSGEMYLGKIDNQGSYIDISTQKMDVIHTILKNKLNSKFRTIFELCGSALPFSYEVNGFCCARIISTQFPYGTSETITNKNYKIVFENCEVVEIPFSSTSGIFKFQFIKSSTAPKLLMIDDDEQYTIYVSIPLLITNGVFYYPLDTFQPIEIIDKGSGTYETILIGNDNLIGYPAFWFTCDETRNGPVFYSDSTVQEFHYGNPATEPYNVNVYVMDKLYDGFPRIRVYPADGKVFTNTSLDFTYSLDLERIQLETDGSPGPVIVTQIPITSSDGNKLYMDPNQDWQYSGQGYYFIHLQDFNTNYSFNETPLKPIFKLELNNTIPFDKTTNDTGYAGIDISAKTQSGSYPFDLNKWSGLPEWIADDENASQRLVVYAIHNTPNSSPNNPESRQTAALLFDPGVPITGEVDEEDQSHIGRIYVLSNDDPEYVNNATAKYPKPERTLARICDIPISVAQLSNITGIAPTPIVDPKYVRSEASYSAAEQKRLYNTLADKWVRPIHKMASGESIKERFENETNDYVFMDSNHLTLVDLYNHNDFRKHIHLNEMVDPEEVSLYMINDGGSGYAREDVGIIVVGGFAFDYIVTDVNDDGGVTEATIAPSGSWEINISNFDMQGTSGVTKVYGTSPRGSGHGTGLKLQLQIANYQTKIPTYGDVYQDIYALCRERDGIWMYNYNTSTSSWNKTVCISEYEVSVPGVLSTKDSYINSILPNVDILPVAYKKADTEDTVLKVISTASFVNVVDSDVTPIYNPSTPNEPIVDINRFYCNRIDKLTAENSKTFNGVIKEIKNHGYDRFDSYIIWRWVDETDSTNREFEFGIIHRSFNNLQSFDNYKSNLPSNELYCKNFVHTNASTTMAWDVPRYDMTLIWTFNPECHVRELYSINADTHDLNVERIKMTWKNVDVYTSNLQSKLDIVDASGKLLWNIASNVLHFPDTNVTRDPIYQQVDYYQIATKGTAISDIPDSNQPVGNWQLIFPRIQNFTFANNTGTVYTPMKMNVLRGVELQDTTIVKDANGNMINYKTLVIDNNDNEASLKVYNSETGRWNSI